MTHAGILSSPKAQWLELCAANLQAHEFESGPYHCWWHFSLNKWLTRRHQYVISRLLVLLPKSRDSYYYSIISDGNINLIIICLCSVPGTQSYKSLYFCCLLYTISICFFHCYCWKTIHMVINVLFSCFCIMP